MCSSKIQLSEVICQKGARNAFTVELMHFSQNALPRNVIYQETCTMSALYPLNPIKDFQMEKICSIDDKTPCEPAWNTLIWVHIHRDLRKVHEDGQRERWEAACSPVANVRIKWGKLTVRCFQRKVYSPLVSFKPTLFSPVNSVTCLLAFFLSLSLSPPCVVMCRCFT